MLKFLTCESSKGYEKKKPDTERSKIMYKYAQLKRCYHDQQLEAYIFAFMYVDSKTVPAEEHFPNTKIFVVNYKTISAPGTVPKH